MIEEKTYHFGDVVITVQIQNEETMFRWRMVTKDILPDWTSFYQGILVLRVGKRMFGLVTPYFEGDFSKEQCFVPFEMKFS